MSNGYDFDVNEYLRCKIVNKGTCKTCNKIVPWSREKIISHKSSGNCDGISDVDRIFFKNQKLKKLGVPLVSRYEVAVPPTTSTDTAGSNDEQPNKRAKTQASINTFADSLTVGQRDEITI